MEKSEAPQVPLDETSGVRLASGVWSRQQLFSNAWNGFEKQNWIKSVGKDDRCLYRGLAGARCAIGWSVLDEWYKPEMEGKVLEDGICKIAHISPYDVEFATQLQNIHDGWNADISLEERKDSMRRFAAYWNLEVPE